MLVGYQFQKSSKNGKKSVSESLRYISDGALLSAHYV
jgi:hypothetical protein